MNGFTKEAWAASKDNPDIRDELLYGAIISLNDSIKKIHKWKYINTAVTGVCSFMGGMMAVWMWARFVFPAN
jgi:hypothetical protein